MGPRTSTDEEQTKDAAAPSGYIRSFNRYELKYLLQEQQVRAFVADLEGYAHVDPYSGRTGYPVYSLYWDSPDLLFFWEKIDGEKYRRKLRFRRYQGGDGAFVEIKQRTDRTVQKRRVLWPFEQIRGVFGNGNIDPARESEVRDKVAMEALFLCRYHGLAPRMAVRYRRHAWFGSHETDLRITFDTRVQYDARALDLEQPFETGKYMLPANMAIMEIKFNDRVPRWLTRLVAAHRLDVVRMSKYCRAVDLELFQGRYS